MTVRNNDVLFNAAQAGFWNAVAQGLQSQSNQNNAPAGTPAGATVYATLAAQALVFAEAVDAAIPNDNGGAFPVSVITTGVAIAPTTGAITAAQLAKTALLANLCAGAMRNRIPLATDGAGVAYTIADFASVAAAIAVAYYAAWPSFQVA